MRVATVSLLETVKSNFSQLQSAFPSSDTAISSRMQKKIESGSVSLATDLYRRLKRDQQNLVVSPFSLSAALSMTLMGCRGKTAEELSQALFGQVIPEKEFEALAKEFKTLVGGAVKDNEEVLSVANFMYIHQGLGLRSDFKRILEKQFDSQAVEVDFQRRCREAINKINNDVSQATHKKIPKLLQEDDVTADTLLVLVNAVYFKGAWKTPFSTEETEELTFTLSTGQEVEVDTMYLPGTEQLFCRSETLKCSAIQLPFKSGNTSMIFLLPDKSSSLKSLGLSLKPQMLDQLIGALGTEILEIWLPKFKFEAKHMLIPVLKQLGIKRLFDKHLADLSGVADNADLFVANVIQKAVIEVNEEGAEATAATFIDLEEDAEHDEPVEFRADRPFLFLLVSQHQERNLILFMGAVEDPRK